MLSELQSLHPVKWCQYSQHPKDQDAQSIYIDLVEIFGCLPLIAKFAIVNETWGYIACRAATGHFFVPDSHAVISKNKVKAFPFQVRYWNVAGFDVTMI